jgi:hypothetical protein
MIIDFEIPTEISVRILGKIQPVMQDWPQYPIGETAVVFFKAFFGKIGDYIFNVLMTH